MTEIRCVKCKRLLMKVSDPIQIDIIAASREGIEIKCSKCSYLNKFTFGITIKGENIKRTVIDLK